MTEKIHKVLARAGVASRRAAEGLVSQRRVKVDGRIASVGDRVDADTQKIELDGKRLYARQKVYYLVNKPRGVLCTNRDEFGRPRVIDLLPEHERVFPVGRLDAESEGLVLVTNDGELANRLIHPRYEVPKTYLVRVSDAVDDKGLETLRSGVWLAEGRARSARVCIKKRSAGSTWLEVTLKQGLNRQVRRMCAHLGYKVRVLKRVRIGPLALGHLAPGAWRSLSASEIEKLRNLVAFRGNEGRKNDSVGNGAKRTDHRRNETRGRRRGPRRTGHPKARR